MYLHLCACVCVCVCACTFVCVCVCVCIYVCVRVFALSGMYIPSCDEDGYYRKLQCDQARGECWCVDQHGGELMGSRIHGNPDCGKGHRLSETMATLWQWWRKLSPEKIM